MESRGLAPTAHTHMDDAKWRCPISIGHRRCRETLDASHAGTKAPNLSDRQPTVNRNKRLSVALGASAYSALKLKEMAHGFFNAETAEAQRTAEEEIGGSTHSSVIVSAFSRLAFTARTVVRFFPCAKMFSPTSQSSQPSYQARRRHDPRAAGLPPGCMSKRSEAIVRQVESISM